jgi:hypothetical protein
LTDNTSPTGWYQDPTGQGDGRYWNGSTWTEAVDRGGVTVNVPIDPNQALAPPVPGTQVSIPASPAAVQPVGGGSTSSGSAIGAIIGLLVVVVIAVVIFMVVTNDSSDSPTPPGTDAPPATEEPATDPPADDG